ncbi:MAG: hypothetical protein A3I24_04105 [Candidatus Harrisonbacteria bacterium RIFCSPLOWO2_02_FULL_41_13b]|uniref:Glutamyl-tRNA amidotransferase n=1 Tax=Candidatus Harrisonbacteria bacterium RIFCSPLOWO2_02_FULL_41_13b TaxID=1798409 RepID=A0A1G1ZQX2_9BACT|nr:MAG: hypothetical protein A3J53_00315 [Candidatus Harrisonbacteria bacterium RIFCSPHIGHO2_02_FULL_40_20]OGY66845.1 MAG: hypothetical protein A3I24_04105 [Candidatus Harrisonbacteria bacterium RIFCSPLOWO2_02_FULL_41_13b]
MLKQRVLSDIKDAMKSGDQNKVGVLRLVSSAIKNKEIEMKPKLGDSEMPEDMVLAVIMMEAKKRKEAIEIFKQGGRNDLAEKEQMELAIIQGYLPQQLSKEEVEKEIEKILGDNLLAGNFGLAMKEVMKSLKGKADGSLVGEILKKKFSSNESR